MLSKVQVVCIYGSDESQYNEKRSVHRVGIVVRIWCADQPEKSFQIECVHTGCVGASEALAEGKWCCDVVLQWYDALK